MREMKEEMKEMWGLNAMWDSGWDSGPGKGH